MTFKQSVEYAKDYLNLIGSWYKYDNTPTAFSLNRTKIEAILVAPKGYSKEVYSLWLKNGRDNEAAVMEFDKDKDIFEPYIYARDLHYDAITNEPLKDYLVKGGFL